MTALAALIAQGEGKHLEFKETLPGGRVLAKSVVAFSNMGGGKIIVGVEDRTSAVVGITATEALDFPDRISDIISSRCAPNILPEMYTASIHDQTVLVIDIYPGPLKPYYLKDKGKELGTYIRVGATNKQADQEMLLELERQRRNISFDAEVDYDQTEQSIDKRRLDQDFFSYTGNHLTTENLLTLRILAKEHGHLYPTRGGLLLAGTQPFFEYARIRCARFKGCDVGEFIDQKDFSGPLYDQVENAMKFALTYVAKAGKIEGLQRIDAYQIPTEAIREALTNAAVHRDYSISGADIKLAVFDDRLEITSPGALPKALTIDEMLSGRSEIRNKVLARFFKEIGFIEQWGTGIRKIVRLCNQTNTSKPEFRESGLFFKVIFHTPNPSPDDHHIVAEETRPMQKRLGEKVGRKGWEKRLGETQRSVLLLMENNPHISSREIAHHLQLSTTAIDKAIAKLKKHNLIERVGPSKGGFWKVSKEFCPTTC